MRIGIDLGGTKIEIVALDEEGGELLRRRLATPRGDYAGTDRRRWPNWWPPPSANSAARGTVGVGTPGAISALSGNLKNSNSTWLNDQPLQRDLEQALGRAIRLANDANCFALSEAVDGAGAGADVVFGVILGTGVGGGIVVRHHVLTGANAIAGEWGHNPLPFCAPSDAPAPACYCGQHGCIETYLSGPGMARDHAAARRPAHGTARHRRRARKPATPPARPRWRATKTAWRAPCRNVINLLDPDVIVLGGGMSNIARLYRNVPRLWQPYVFSDQVATRLVPNRHGDSSGVRGAAWLWS